MSDEDERQLNSSSNSQPDVDNRRRLSEIKMELQALMRQKKKYDEDKLKQEADFLHSEINDLRNSISDINKEINNQTQTKKKLHIQVANLRSSSRLRYTNLAIALRDKRRYEAELKKENKTEEYRDLARREIRSIDAALPILKKEEEYKTNLKEAEDAQQTATIKRKKLEESLNKNLRKQTEIKQLLSENAEKLPQIEETIENLRCEREQLLSSTSSNGKKPRRRISSNHQRSIDSPTTDSQTPIHSLASVEEDRFEHEKLQYEDQLNKINILLKYFHEKLIEHGLNHDTELTSSSYHPITPNEERTILSSYMDEQNSDQNHLTIINNNETTSAIAMKLPRNFAPLNLNLTTTNEIIHSPYYDGKNEFEYKKELSSDILNKYGGQQKKTKQQFLMNGKKHKKNKKNFAITHNPQMIALYNNIRSSTGSSDTLSSMPMYEYDLYPTIQSLEFLKQSLESYLNELITHYKNLSINDNDDIRDSALDTVSETSSLIEPIKENFQSNLLDDKKTLTSSSSSSSNHSDIKKDYQTILTTVGELTTQIDRQISDEGYRSVPNEQQEINSNNSDSTDRVGQWLNESSSSLTKSINYNNDLYN